MLTRRFRLSNSGFQRMAAMRTMIGGTSGVVRASFLALSLGLALVMFAEEVGAEGIGLDPMARHYQLGRGLSFDDTGLRLGGYGVAAARETNGDPAWQTAIESVSAFVWWESNEAAWRFFTELEVEDVIVARPGEVTTTDDVELQVERLYIDYAGNDVAKVRLGKFLTPVGRWNLIHAAPLVWTSSRPLITENTFPTNATGAMLYGFLETPLGGLDYAIYASPGEELFRAKGKDTFNEAYGGHVALTPWPTMKVGLSFVDFELTNSTDQRRQLYGFDFHWAYRRFELTGEYAYRISSRGRDVGDERGGYLQFVAPLTEKLYAVGRYEQFEQSGAAHDLDLFLMGVAYRWVPAIVLKAEFSKAWKNDIDFIDGWRASAAVLF
jgi:hypothetical protein